MGCTSRLAQRRQRQKQQQQRQGHQRSHHFLQISQARHLRTVLLVRRHHLHLRRSCMVLVMAVVVMVRLFSTRMAA